MATIRTFDILVQDKEREQNDSEASLVLLKINGERFVQLNSYGSSERVNVGAPSQNMRLTKAAFEELVLRGTAHFSVAR
ncbi:hypothetical protein GCM10011529_08870 [Polymorphobacter glacialis]|uniref:Uncharacterized protein n=1 Tax=Sandarakinorhabdus glacialis TaxID=1614636 RepID=A0A916ZMA4_9SPHN|nr:hypothetical protein [Polymorphobacter glacialis]GGE04746.1 hypothetical protein GCM10011529_08870 [Polymorphobacter glacialis]